VEPDDLMKFGMIPEFIGRLPIITALEELDEPALVNILSQPKNALTKQYKKLFELDGVNLKFTDGALKAIAQEAIRRKAGARGLRSILEGAMLDVMYDIPSRKTAREVLISEETILKKSEPVVLHANEKDAEPKKESA
jgi:ATP-dependent Clp protease ATP-binding subunit ClpX